MAETAAWTDPARLRTEAAAFGRYLLGREISPQLADRYVRACAALHPRPEDGAETALVDFAFRHPHMLPLLDAALGLLRPDALLRRKLLTLLAILEATPDHAEFFTPCPHAKVVAVARLAAWSIAGAAKCVGGLIILPFASRRR